ncbi:MAG: S-adenosylmethionine:tRNA ribosyltransferase-isomerase [Bacteroidota bacterium]|jgi:S-adenosylmethionine:tRNA ribosyltransferase-isomerase
MSVVRMPEVFIQDYDYELPTDLIAVFPKEKRDESKLLVFKKGEINHHQFSDLPEILPVNTCLVFNNTKVIPARILIEKSTGASIELFLLRPNLSQNFTDVLKSTEQMLVWEALVGNKKRWKSNDVLTKQIEIHQQQIKVHFAWHNREENLVKISWDQEVSMVELLDYLGKTPLPPYMEREANELDEIRYQTVFSKEVGAVAAPTASLHFTEKTFADLKSKKMLSLFLTLHVGAGTFLPVKEENVSNHPMHKEQVVISKELIEHLIQHEGKFIPVGTTVLRALESLYWSGIYLLENPKWNADFLLIPKEYPYIDRHLPSNKTALSAVLNYLKTKGKENWVFETEILIMPGYTFRFCDALVTNFHQPKSTLMVLISALVGDSWKRIYQTAKEKEYRFLSYGDSSLLFNHNV